MKKRILSLLLCTLMAFGICVPAYAADESLEEELTRVTLAVKDTLSINDKYTDFTGNVNDMGVLRYWSLRWSDDAGDSIQVLAADTGKVMQYNSNSAEPMLAVTGGSYAPSFSRVTAAQAKDSAQQFLGTVLSKGETAKLEENSAASSVSLSGSDYSISAQILLNGVPSPNRAQLQVSAETGAVTYFSRDDCYEAYVNDVPSAVPAVSQSAAANTLAGTVNLELQYVLPEGGDGSTAVLRYVPVAGDDYYVDAQTGTLTDLTKAWENVNGNTSVSPDKAASTTTAGNAESMASDSRLSEAEQAAIQKLQGVQSQDALDQKVRQITALGLGRYTLSSASYAMDPKTGDVTCTLYYTRNLPYSELNNITSAQYQEGSYQQTKALQLNAKTGALLSGWSYRPWYMKETKADRSGLQPAADSFLALCYPDYAGKVTLTDGEGGEFRYDRKENGYFYHSDYVYISMDPSDGSVASFCASWSEGLTFQTASGIVSAQTAKDAYCGAYTAQLGYIAYPVSVNVSIPIWKTYAACCGYVAYRYVLGYTYETDSSTVLGVDGKTGKPVMQTQKTAVAYSDIADSYAKEQIEALAAAGIGFGAGSKFQPTAQLTQKDMLVLLLNSCGYSFDTDQLDGEETLDSLYSAAWSQGFLSRGSRDPDHPVTRLELVKAILDASPYGPAAKLQGIFVISFTDADQIPADSQGYAALAQGLGIIHGDRKGRLLPNATVTRQSAAVILYNYMKRA